MGIVMWLWKLTFGALFEIFECMVLILLFMLGAWSLRPFMRLIRRRTGLFTRAKQAQDLSQHRCKSPQAVNGGLSGCCPALLRGRPRRHTRKCVSQALKRMNHNTMNITDYTILTNLSNRLLSSLMSNLIGVMSPWRCTSPAGTPLGLETFLHLVT